MKSFIIGILSSLFGLVLGLTINLGMFDAFDLAKFEKRRDLRYSDILLTVGAAHKLGYDGAVWKLIGPFGRNMSQSLIEQQTRDQLRSLIVILSIAGVWTFSK